MAINPSIDPISSTEFTVPTTDQKSKAGLGVKLSTAAISALGPADMALSDGLFAKTYNAIGDHVTPFQDAMMNKITQAGALSGVVFAESFLMGMLVARNNTIRGSFNAYKEYSEKKELEMNLARKALSRVIQSPLAGISWVGEKINNLGNKISDSSLPLAENVGSLVADIGNTNALGTTTVVTNESMQSDKPLRARRVASLAATITGSWLATAEAVRATYRGIGELGKPGQAIQNGIGAFARGLDALTTVGVNPAETPVGSLFMGAVVGSLAVTGWNIAEMKHSMDLQQPAFEPIRTDS